MAKIRQYFAPIRELAPDREGWTAMERAARAEDELYRETARDYEEAGTIWSRTLRDMGWPYDIFHLEATGRRLGGGHIKIGKSENPFSPYSFGGAGATTPQQENYNQFLSAIDELNENLGIPNDSEDAVQPSEGLYKYWTRTGQFPQAIQRAEQNAMTPVNQISTGAAAIGRMASLYAQDTANATLVTPGGMTPTPLRNGGTLWTEPPGTTVIDTNTGMPIGPIYQKPFAENDKVFDQIQGKYVPATNTYQESAQSDAYQQKQSAAWQRYQSQYYHDVWQRQYYLSNPDVPQPPGFGPPQPPSPVPPQPNVGTPVDTGVGPDTDFSSSNQNTTQQSSPADQAAQGIVQNLATMFGSDPNLPPGPTTPSSGPAGGSSGNPSDDIGSF